MATESGGDETGGPGDETGDKTAATAGDERDGGDRWSNVCGRRSAYNRLPPTLFGEHCEILWNLDDEFTRCTRWPGQPSIIDPVMNAANVKKALCI